MTSADTGPLNPSIKSEAPHLGTGVRAAYGLGALAVGVSGTVLAGSVLQLYFNQVIGLPAAWVGAAIMATIIIDSITDPLIGRFSDNLRTPWGRRHVLMYASAIPSALGVYLMWQAPQSLGPVGVLAFMIGMLLFVRIATSFFDIPARALAPELAPGYHERTKLIAWRFVFAIAGGAALSAILYQVFLREDAANPLGVLNRDRYADFGAFAAVLIFLAIVVSTLATHKYIRHLHVPPARASTLAQTLGELKVAFGNRQLISLLFATLLNGFGGGLWFGLMAYIGLNFWDLKPQEFAFLLLAAPASSLISLWAAPRISAKTGKRVFLMGTYVCWFVMFTTPFLARFLGVFPENGDALLLVVLVCFSFVELIFAYGTHTVLNSMLADATDDVAVRTGRRSEGALFAGYGLLDKWGAALGAFCAGLVLTIVAFPIRATPGEVDSSIMDALVLWTVPAVGAVNLLAMGLISRFKIDEHQHERNVATLRAREEGSGG